MPGGSAGLIAIWLIVAWSALFGSQAAGLRSPNPPTLDALHAGVVEVDWDDVADAERYELQWQRSSAWVVLPDDDLGIEAWFNGSQAVVGNLPADTRVDAFRVRAGDCRGWSDWSEPAQQATTHDLDWDGVVVPVPGPPADGPASSVDGSDDEEAVRLSTCERVRLATALGEELIWPKADLSWSFGPEPALRVNAAADDSAPPAIPLMQLRPLLTAAFEDVPHEHSGNPFSLLLRFSESVVVDADTLRSDLLRVTGGSLAAMRRVDGRSDLWELTIAPDGRFSVGVRLAGSRSCTVPGAICTERRVALSNQPEVMVTGPPVTAEFRDAPAHHSGLDHVAVRIALSERVFTTPRRLAELGLQVTNGSVSGVRRVGGRSDLWELLVVPESSDDLVIRLAPPADCSSSDLACLELRRIADSPSLSIPPATVHLTFDDGPDPRNTPKILDILARHNARATFFVVGVNVVTYPELIERIVSEGHTLANHTWRHDDLVGLSDEAFEATLLRTQRALGQYATPCFRPPFYHFDDDTIRRAKRLGLKMILNTAGTGDWRHPGADVIADRIVAGAGPNAILVLHDGGGTRTQTVEALDDALTRLQAQRYVYEPVCR